MYSPVTLVIFASLLALVAVACTALCLAWINPTWRQRIGLRWAKSNAEAATAACLSGLSYRIGRIIIATGVGACALIAWIGFYWTLAAH